MEANIDDTIKRIEVLFESITGSAPPEQEGAYSPIPPELDAGNYVEKQLERLLELVGAPEPVPTWLPPLSIAERGDELIIELDVPGMSQSDISVSVADRLLTVKGSKGGPLRGDRVLLSERGFGPFVRSMMLPATADATQISVSVKDGRAEIRIPSKASAPAENMPS